MTDPVTANITRLLREWQAGDRESLDRLIPLVYDELHTIAVRHMARERKDSGLQATVLINEAFMKLVDQRNVDWQSRAHFFAIAAQIMRRILVDDARGRHRQKRGGGTMRISLDALADTAPVESLDILDIVALDRALRDLERIDPGQGRIVELRFFGELTIEETAAVVGLSPTTVKREWAIAKGWLYRALTTSRADGAG